MRKAMKKKPGKKAPSPSETSFEPGPLTPTPPKGGMGFAKKALLGCGVMVLVPIVLVVGFVGFFIIKSIGQPESGVKYANEMDKYALTYLSENKILTPGEDLIAYFDETMEMKGAEAAVLTSKRLLYIKENHVTEMKVADIEKVTHRKDFVYSDIIEVTDIKGKLMDIEIAALNDGDKFLTALMGAWKHENPVAWKPVQETAP